MVQVGEVGNRADGDKNWEFDKRSKHFSFGGHFINSHNFFPCFCMDIIFEIGHSWDLKGYNYDRPGECSLNKTVVDCDLTTCMWGVYLQYCNLSSVHICCHITTNLFIKGIHDCLGKNMQQGLVMWLDC